MREFRFFHEDDDEELYVNEDSASWIFGRRENLGQYRYEIVQEDHYGIHSFLNEFPSHYIVTVLSITGPNNRIHTDLTEYEDGWGFDITRDRIIIEWVRYLN